MTMTPLPTMEEMINKLLEGYLMFLIDGEQYFGIHNATAILDYGKEYVQGAEVTLHLHYNFLTNQGIPCPSNYQEQFRSLLTTFNQMWGDSTTPTAFRKRCRSATNEIRKIIAFVNAEMGLNELKALAFSESLTPP